MSYHLQKLLILGRLRGQILIDAQQSVRMGIRSQCPREPTLRASLPSRPRTACNTICFRPYACLIFGFRHAVLWGQTTPNKTYKREWLYTHRVLAEWQKADAGSTACAFKLPGRYVTMTSRPSIGLITRDSERGQAESVPIAFRRSLSSWMEPDHFWKSFFWRLKLRSTCNRMMRIKKYGEGLEPEHVSEAERCDAQLNIPLCGGALRSVAHGQSKRSTNVPLTLTGKPNPAQITLWH